ncbi:MAG: TolC family protein, partial [Nannocystaceae bacterium]|nr:TolC family protein [Nannocystaceae bacterium]
MVLLPFLSFLLISSSSANPRICDGPLTRQKVIACAQAASPRLEVDRRHIDAAAAQRETARVLLPANPVLSGSLSHRANRAGATAINATGTLSQQIEIGGQRRRRMAVADAQVSEAKTTLASTRREVAAEALLAYYAVIAARTESEVVDRSLATARQLEEVARERANAGVAAPLDVELAAAERTRTEEQAILARGQVALASTRLAVVLGLEPGATPQVQGELVPMAVEGGGPVSTADAARSSRPELATEQARRRTEQARIGLLRRSRLPNPSLSVFVQRDGFDERVIGGGISFPIPLPAPLGRVNKGKIATARSRMRESEARSSAIRRKVAMEATTAAHTYEARRAATAVYPPEAA